MESWNSNRADICARIGAQKSCLKIILKTKNEEVLLARWVEHSARIVGLENLIVFDHGSTSAIVQEYYAKRTDLFVVQYEGFLDAIHNANSFRPLYEALHVSCEYFVFLDTDELLIFADPDGAYIADDRIIDHLSAHQKRPAFPGTWLQNVTGLSDRFYLRGEGDLVGGLRWGKPIVSTALALDGNILHNGQLNKLSAYDENTTLNFFVLHLRELFPAQRVCSNMRKLISLGAVAREDDLAAVLEPPLERFESEFVRTYVQEIRRLVSLPKDYQGDVTGSIELIEGRIEFESEAQQGLWRGFFGKTFPYIRSGLLSYGKEAKAASLDQKKDHQVTETVRDQIVRTIWRNKDPLKDYSAGQTDLQGWGSTHPYLAQGIRAHRPRVVVEVGVWKGGSVVTMAKEINALGIDSVVVAIDTWLGAWDHWSNETLFPMLEVRDGHPTLYQTFMSNISNEGLSSFVVPLPLDSLNAAVLFKKKGIVVDMLHIDAAHDYTSVMADLTNWWPILNPGGLLIGDDYSSGWPEVVRAFDEFFGPLGLTPIENLSNKCRLRKPL